MWGAIFGFAVWLLEKLLGGWLKPKSAVEKIEDTDNAMLQRAVDRDSPADTDDKLRGGKF